MGDGGRGVGTSTKKGKALMNKVELAVPGLGPRYLDVLNGKGHIWGN